MVPDVDCAIIHSCDWDTHVQKARPFVEAGKAVLLDKPIAGSPADLATILEWARGGARITGGSSLRFCAETRDWLARPLDERGTPHTVICGCAVDEFNYGIHAYSQLAGLMSGKATAVRHLAGSPQHRVQVAWPDGRTGIVIVGKVSGWVPFYATVVTERGATQYVADAGRLYRSLLEACLPYLSGESDIPPVDMDELLEPERWAIAARTSWLEGNGWVDLAGIERCDGYDGAAFAVEYQAMRYPKGCA
jgi:hypothetical protein